MYINRTQSFLNFLCYKTFFFIHTIFKDKITELNSEVSIEGCGYYGEVKDDDIAESKGDIKVGGDNFSTKFKADMAATWVVTVNLTNNTCTATKQ